MIGHFFISLQKRFYTLGGEVMMRRNIWLAIAMLLICACAVTPDQTNSATSQKLQPRFLQVQPTEFVRQLQPAFHRQQLHQLLSPQPQFPPIHLFLSIPPLSLQNLTRFSQIRHRICKTLLILKRLAIGWVWPVRYLINQGTP